DVANAANRLNQYKRKLRQSPASRFHTRRIAQVWREFVGVPGGEADLGERDEFDADLRLAARTVDQTGCGDGFAADGADGVEAFARRQACGHDVFDHQHRLAFFELEAAA